MFFANILAGIGSLLANVSSTACLGVIWDEPECPKSLIK
ncbi:MAG: cyclic lactone autoinducer peptide [Firmicutes bacterium]|nr:cyclic lactone autoinducer peptide [Bacillota bacterium]